MFGIMNVRSFEPAGATSWSTETCLHGDHASAREQGIYTKQFQGTAQSTLWLDWATTPGSDDEQRISQLTRWVMDADALNQAYGLRLPSREFAPDNGPAHLQKCLQALALM